MIIVILYLSLLGFSIGMVLRSTAKATSEPWPRQRATRISPPLGLKDDPAQWPATRSHWTALDERQLIRLLTDSAP